MPLKDGSYKGANWATRRALLEMLKMKGTLSSARMADELGISSMAVRQHMQELESGGDVTSESRSEGKGRPTKYWTLTPLSERHFPDRHRDLMLDLLDNLQDSLGEEAMERVLDTRCAQQKAVYGERLRKKTALAARVRELAEIRTEEGYMAEAFEEEPGVFTLVENHCPICSAAAACRGLCARELEVFEETLGPSCKVERIEHMLDNARRCSYRIKQVG